MKKLTTEEFIVKAKIVHGNKYDYKLVSYSNNKIKVKIICFIHGEFEQKPNSHLLGLGCRKCSSEDMGLKQTSNLKEWSSKANKVHSFKYNYSKSVYAHAQKKILIICNKHGEFWQTANSHLNGIGCPKCVSSKGEDKIRIYLLDKNIGFEEQKIFNDCKNIRGLPFDFYIPEYNLLIEFDGMHHFKPITYGGCSKEKALENLILQKERDKIKNEYARHNNIKLLRIPYWKISNVDNILASVVV
jgi:very-short-patch-repair endonuclease/Zn finger protein HypA/HybF involved in hydrogenase expression